MKQKYSSKNTLVNIKQLPMIYNKLNLEKIKGKIIFDYGAGNIKTVNMIRMLLEPYDIEYIPYDIYNLFPSDNCYALERIDEADIYICSNLLNVIEEDKICQNIINKILLNTTGNKSFFFKVYEGDKSNIGKQTKTDCYQRNMITKEYLWYFNWKLSLYEPLIYKNIITNIIGKEFLR